VRNRRSLAPTRTVTALVRFRTGAKTGVNVPDAPRRGRLFRIMPLGDLFAIRARVLGDEPSIQFARSLRESHPVYPPGRP